MEEVFARFKELYEKRFQSVPVMDMGEDSVRYDFFLALKEVKNLNSWDIQLEYPINKKSFIERNNINRKRNEKPQVDLLVNNQKLNITCEFGLFRHNSNLNGTINKTDRLFKMLNDFLRLKMHSYFSECTGYFICVADEKMLKHQLRNKKLNPFPSKNYEFNYSQLIEIIGETKNELDIRFVEKFKELNLTLKAELIYNKNIVSEINTLETKILVWEIIN